MRNEFTAVVQRGEQGWLIAHCPEIPGANGQGRTMAEVLQNLKDGIALELEMRREEGLKDLPTDAVRETVVVGRQ